MLTKALYACFLSETARELTSECAGAEQWAYSRATALQSSNGFTIKQWLYDQ